MRLDTQWVRDWMELAARQLSLFAGRLTELDGILGDGDHGCNLANGFAAVEQRLSGAEFATPREALRIAANTLLAAVGGAAGPLYGTALLRAAKAAKDPLLDGQAVALMLVKAAEGISERGGAQPGDKTMLDAWYPAATAAAQAFSQGANVAQILRAAADAADVGAEDTVSMTATKGRAALLSGQSLGHEDPGARSSALILEAAAQAAGG